MSWSRPAISPTPNPAHSRGKTGEDMAAEYLMRCGYKIVQRNWRPGNHLRGEIDCIAWHHDERNVKVLCFIEVKTRSSNRMGTPQSAVNERKQRQLSTLANAFISVRKWHDIPCRFDVVEVWLSANTSPEIALHQNAFDYRY